MGVIGKQLINGIMLAVSFYAGAGSMSASDCPWVERVTRLYFKNRAYSFQHCLESERVLQEFNWSAKEQRTGMRQQVALAMFRYYLESRNGITKRSCCVEDGIREIYKDTFSNFEPSEKRFYPGRFGDRKHHLNRQFEDPLQWANRGEALFLWKDWDLILDKQDYRKFASAFKAFLEGEEEPTKLPSLNIDQDEKDEFYILFSRVALEDMLSTIESCLSDDEVMKWTYRLSYILFDYFLEARGDEEDETLLFIRRFYRRNSLAEHWRRHELREDPFADPLGWFDGEPSDITIDGWQFEGDQDEYEERAREFLAFLKGGST